MDRIDCTEEEQRQRLDFCKACPSFKIKEDHTTECTDCGCSISLMISFLFKECPKGNWTV